MKNLWEADKKEKDKSGKEFQVFGGYKSHVPENFLEKLSEGLMTNKKLTAKTELLLKI